MRMRRRRRRSCARAPSALSCRRNHRGETPVHVAIIKKNGSSCRPSRRRAGDSNPLDDHRHRCISPARSHRRRAAIAAVRASLVTRGGRARRAGSGNGSSYLREASVFCICEISRIKLCHKARQIYGAIVSGAHGCAYQCRPRGANGSTWRAKRI